MNTLHKKSTNLYEEQFLYNIANSEIRTYPWTHILFDEIFHPEQYNLIQQNLPDIKLLTDIREVKFHNPGYSPNRFVLNSFDDLPKNQKQFWIEIQNQFLNGRLKDILLHKFNKNILDRIGENNIEYVEFYDTFQLTWDKKSYELSPHPDAFDKVFTIVVNLPKDDSNIEMGTVIYSSNNPSNMVYRSKYLPNTGFGVFRAEDSWHGVEQTTADRWTIQYTIWGRDKT